MGMGLNSDKTSKVFLY